MANRRYQHSGSKPSRAVKATFARKQVPRDPRWQWEFADSLRHSHSREELMALYSRHRDGESSFDQSLRRVILHALCRRVGHGLQVGPAVVFKHPETMEFGDGVFIGAQAIIQGRFDGNCRIGNRVWIGPQAFLDARDLTMQDYVGWGPGAKLLGSAHTGKPVSHPIITTDLVIAPVVVERGADVGTNATVLPGIRIGAHAMVGAGAVVTSDVPDYAVVAGVPARVVRSRRKQ